VVLRFELRDLHLAIQVLYHLNNIPSLFLFFFLRQVLAVQPRLAWTLDPPASDCPSVGITSVPYHSWPFFLI
jgi:hypothetical protein